MTLLNSVSISLLQEGYQIGLDWLGQCVRAIIESVGIIGVGIICFTLILKAITLPFDVYQRVKTRKQTLIMRGMREDLDKLQQQYANDKTMYNQKMMELYKKNGYSMFGACLPMIISFVVIIVAFQGFNAYSRYANLNFFVEMSGDYNAAILANGEQGIDYLLARGEDGNILVGEDGSVTFVWTDEAGEEQQRTVRQNESFTENGCTYTMSDVGNVKYYLTVVPENTDKYIFYGYSLEATSVSKAYSVDTDRLSAWLQANDAEAYESISSAENFDSACLDYVKGIGATAAKNWYEGHRANFLWVENVWYPDVSYNHPIPQDYATFQQNFGNTQVTLRPHHSLDRTHGALAVRHDEVPEREQPVSDGGRPGRQDAEDHADHDAAHLCDLRIHVQCGLHDLHVDLQLVLADRDACFQLHPRQDLQEEGRKTGH